MLSTAKSSLKVSLISLILIFSLTEVSLAHLHHSYSHDVGRPVADNPNWMSVLRADLRLSALSIPGTHETMSRYGLPVAGAVLAGAAQPLAPVIAANMVITQTLSLREQLESGIRVLDIRCARNDKTGGFDIYHGPIYQRATFDDVLRTVVAFLKDHEGETVLMRVKEEYTNNPWAFAQMFKKYWNSDAYKDYFWTGKKDENGKPRFDQNPTLGEMRKKIVILQDFAREQCPKPKRDDIPDNPLPNQPDFGICYSTFASQDAFYMRTNENLYQKWLYVKNHLAAANSGSRPEVKYMNYLTASGGVFPYFVVSGHSNPATGAGRLATRFPSYRKLYPDFPRFAGFIHYEGTNTLVYGAIRTGYYTKRVGIIMTDFPGGGLIERIICINYPQSDPLCKRLPPCTGPMCP
jgi:1-phosphatidylinositol phosphodiesterase